MDKTQIDAGKDSSCQTGRMQIRTGAFSFYRVRAGRLVEFCMYL